VCCVCVNGGKLETLFGQLADRYAAATKASSSCWTRYDIVSNENFHNLHVIHFQCLTTVVTSFLCRGLASANCALWNVWPTVWLHLFDRRWTCPARGWRHRWECAAGVVCSKFFNGHWCRQSDAHVRSVTFPSYTCMLQLQHDTYQLS